MTQSPEPSIKGLSGPWMGRYNYVSRAVPPVAFNATLSDDAGAIGGETHEPNTFADDAPDMLIAGVIGVHEDGHLHFTKTYSDFDAPRIAYEGKSNPQLTRIEGRWHIPSAPWVHGTFVMIRDAQTVTARTERRRNSRSSIAMPLGGTPEEGEDR
ncbi:MAG: hypothetical protein AAFO93_09825 [Pseudomonadota bacterium]